MKRFMDLPDEYSKNDSYFAVFPLSFEGNVTYGKGASKGAEEIIKASGHLEYYDEQFGNEAFEKGIFTFDAVEAENGKDMVSKIKKNFPSNNFVLSLGGDHSVTMGCVRALERRKKDFSVIILDAHADFFDSWNNSQYNHRCVAKNIAGKHKVLSIGVRSMDVDEAELIKENENMNIIKAYEFSFEKLKQGLDNLGENVYISIDADVFDISFIKNTGTPEPGGFLWDKVIGILKTIFEDKNVISADIVEFAPVENFRAEAFSLAKLGYKVMSMKKAYAKK
ncbi:agmatinase [Candidatus Woesearchaeota archaeon]|nr:agmatinase [Candidatus Woesearchaeota archaeon]